MESERQDESSQDQIEHRVTIVGKTVKVKLDRGQKLSDLLKKIREEYADELKHLELDKCNIVLNGRTINMSGEIEDNPTLSTVSTLTIMTKITGGEYEQ